MENSETHTLGDVAPHKDDHAHGGGLEECCDEHAVDLGAHSHADDLWGHQNRAAGIGSGNWRHAAGGGHL